MENLRPGIYENLSKKTTEKINLRDLEEIYFNMAIHILMLIKYLTAWKILSRS